MNSKPYLRFWLSFTFCILCVFAFAFSLSKLNSLKTEKNSLKQVIKLDSLLLLSRLDEKLDFLIDRMEQIKLKGVLLPNSPFSKLITLHKNQIESFYLESPSEIKEINLAQLQKIIDSNLSLITSAKKDEIQFKKIKENNKSHFILIRSIAKDKQEIAFFKRNTRFFKLSQSKEKGIQFVTVTKNNNIFFYDTKIKKLRRAQLLESLLKASSDTSKYMAVKNKKKSDTELYYLRKWKKTNLYLISQLKKSALISKSVFFEKLKYKWTLILTFVLFCVSAFAFWFYLSSLVSAYNFLKSVVISFSENGKFPLSPPKNPLLYFYNNRNTLLAKKEQISELTDKPENESFQSLIKKEVKSLKSRWPNMTVKEDFHSNVKAFGSNRFLKVLIHELLLNALESMGAMEKQEIKLTLTEEKNNLVFSIRDYGEGAPDIKKAFKMYHSTKSQLGVGLNLVQSLVKANGGKIELQSLKEGGAQATVHLPLKCFLK